MFLLFVTCLCVSHINHGIDKVLKLEILHTQTPLFLNDSLVNKLLTQNMSHKLVMSKDSLDLNILENQMSSIPEIKNVQTYITLENKLFLSITEREPLFKVVSSPPRFSDLNGKLFTFKTIDSLYVPSFETSSSTISISLTAKFIKKLLADPFLRRELEKVYLKNNNYQIKLKSYDFKIIFGKPTRIAKKIKKLKVFCTLINDKDSMENYTNINLSYMKQIVALTS